MIRLQLSMRRNVVIFPTSRQRTLEVKLPGLYLYRTWNLRSPSLTMSSTSVYPEIPPCLHIHKPDPQTRQDRPQTLGEDRHHLRCRFCHVSSSYSPYCHRFTIVRIGFVRPYGTCTRTISSSHHMGTLSLERIRKVVGSHTKCHSRHRNPSTDWLLR